MHAHAAGLLPILDPQWRAKIWRAGLILCVPCVGWPALLGYRARFVRHLFHDTPAPLPDWREGLWGFVREGLLAMAVIFGHLAPLYAVVAWLAIERGYRPDSTATLLAVTFLTFPIFSTLSFPIGAVLLTSGGWLGGGECAVALAVWALLIFLVPAGFLQVTLHRRHRSAFGVWRTVPFVLRNLRAYAAAWWHSGLMSLAGHLVLPLSPWGIAWCYLGILALFNEVLLVDGTAPGEGWLQRAHADERLRRRRAGLARVRDDSGRECRVLSLGAFAAPLP